MSDLRESIKDFFRRENYACLVCGGDLFDGSFLCKECRKKFPYNNGAICDKCGRRTAEAGVCVECSFRMPLYDRARSCFSHEEGAKALLLRYKAGDRYLLRFFNEPLFETFSLHYGGISFDGITYAPLYPKDEKERGFNQARELAVLLSERTGIPLLDGIKKTVRTKRQKSLSAKERIENLKGCFSADRTAKGKVLLLVDDVITTGVTAETLTKELKKRGAKAVYVLTLNAVPYQNGER